MLKRRGKGQRPQVVFTSDFHELVRGDLLPGACVLRYDPHRIVPPAEISGLPRTQRPITAHVRLHPEGALWTGEMKFPPASRLVADYDPTGQGTMLEIEFPIPAHCDGLECWFSYVDDTGHAHWDSDAGTNFWLRFPTHDLEILRAEIAGQKQQPMDRFEIEIESVPDVSAMKARWRYTNAINDNRIQQQLVATASKGKKRWMFPEGGVPVAWKAALALDVVYTAGGHEYTDDNDGAWYTISRADGTSR